MATFEQTTSNNQRSSQSDEEQLDYSNITLTYLIEEKFLPRALRSGVKIDEFYEYTLGEMKLIIEAYDDCESNRLRMEAQMDYAHSICLTSFMATLLSKDAKAPRFEDIYSFLYTADELAEIEERKEQAMREAEMKKQQASWMAFANAFNIKREQKLKDEEDSSEDGR